MVDACRTAVRAHFQNPPVDTHAGLVLDRGLARQDDNHLAAAEMIGRLARLGSPAVYEPAFRRWQFKVEANPTCSVWYGEVAGRLSLGLGNESVLEVGLTLHHTYGVPVVPGSAVKGVVRGCDTERWAIDSEVMRILFGETESAGYLRFHDAWWVPDAQATFLAREVTCVHHPDYYTTGGTSLGDHPVGMLDLDSPIPVSWIAATGTFLFSIEGPAGWHERAMEVLQDALTTHGIGAKTAAGYGLFRPVDERNKAAARRAEQAQRAALPLAERLRAEVAAWDEKRLATVFGKDWNKTREERDDEEFGRLCEIAREIHGAKIQGWETADKKSNQKKAWKRLYGGVEGCG